MLSSRMPLLSVNVLALCIHPNSLGAFVQQEVGEMTLILIYVSKIAK
jgi:hypothetical protein